MRHIPILVLTVLTTGCANIFEPPDQMLVYNGCRDSYMVIRDGRNDVLVPRLEAGQTDGLPVTGRAGDEMELTASAFSSLTGRELGAATISVNVPTRYWSDSNGNSGRTRDSSVQLRTWEIRRLSTQLEPDYDCQRGFRQR